MTEDREASLIVDTAGLVALEAEWWGLFEACPAATPFRSPAWLLPWWAVFGPGELRVVAVRRKAELVGLAPLYREAASRRLLPLGIGITDDLDMLALPGFEVEVGEAVLSVLGACSDWQTLSLEELAPGATGLCWAVPKGWLETRDVQSQSPVLAWPAGSGNLDAVVPARKMRKLRMARHRLARRSGLVETADAATAPAKLDALFRLHAARWESRGEAGVLADPAVQAFHRRAVPRLAARGLLELIDLSIDGRVAGVFYGVRRGGALYAYLGGFDPDFAFESPGTVLIGHALDTMTAAGAGSLDLLRGQEAYKYDWGAVDRPHIRRTLSRSLDP